MVGLVTRKNPWTYGQFMLKSWKTQCFSHESCQFCFSLTSAEFLPWEPGLFIWRHPPINKHTTADQTSPHSQQEIQRQMEDGRVLWEVDTHWINIFSSYFISHLYIMTFEGCTIFWGGSISSKLPYIWMKFDPLSPSSDKALEFRAFPWRRRRIVHMRACEPRRSLWTCSEPSSFSKKTTRLQ